MWIMFQPIQKLAMLLKCGKSLSYHRPIDWAKLWSLCFFMRQKHPTGSIMNYCSERPSNESYSCGESSYNRYYLFFSYGSSSQWHNWMLLILITHHHPSAIVFQWITLLLEFLYISKCIMIYSTIYILEKYPYLVVLQSIINSHKVVERFSQCRNVDYDNIYNLFDLRGIIKFQISGKRGAWFIFSSLSNCV